MKKAMLSVIAAGFVVAPAMGQLWENPDTNGVNGISNATEAPFGARRQVLDDFELGSAATVDTIVWNHIWNTLPPGSGTDIELRFRADDGGAPGSIIGTYVTTTSYEETSTGRQWFGRNEAESTASFEGVNLDAGTYWIDATVVGPENNFWMVSDSGPLAACWVDYADFGGLQPGANVFGVDYHMDFALFGGAGGPSLATSGACPGTFTATVTGATGGGFVALIAANETGSVQIPNGNPCAGTVLGLGRSAFEAARTRADGGGTAVFSQSVPRAACGLFIQALDVSSCGTTNVEQVN